MSDYYGFTNEERVKGGRIQTWAYKKGWLVRPVHCVACNVYGDVPGQIIAHLEDYTEPIAGAIFLCYRCHTMVHQRFAHPEAWTNYIEAVRSGYSWPLTRSRSAIFSDHISPDVPLFPTRVPANPPRPGTVLDMIDKGILHPGDREVWGDKMDAIMEGERPYWIPPDDESLFG